ncbi:MAG: hypothetical protein HQ518_06480 [Rhodopirellula sp.]|nr:hypothetical protein [Rhodopirellula sp.]
MRSYYPEKRHDKHNRMTRRGGKSRRSRYTLPIRQRVALKGDCHADTGCLGVAALQVQLPVREESSRDGDWQRRNSDD